MRSIKSLAWALGCAVGMSVVSAFALATESLAQNTISPDNTLGSERSLVEPLSANIDAIRGGSIREQNLFHSFEQFSIGDGNGAYFVTDSDAISNIFARVTGQGQSDIFGTLGTAQLTNNSLVSSSADLYLINPNGVVFGENSSIDVGASFVVTTADSIGFGDEEYSAADPNLPSSTLIVNPSTYLFTQAVPGNIESRSIVSRPLGSNFLGLRVPDGESLTLIGGNVTINGGNSLAGLHAFGGRVELTAIGGQGEVGIEPDGGLLFSDTTPNGTVLLTDRAQIDVSLNGGGDINITAGDITVTNASLLNAGISQGLGVEGSQAGDIVLDATRTVNVEASTLENNVDVSAIGDSGEIIVHSNTLQVTGGSQIASSTLGKGDAGNVVISAADNVLFDGESANGQIRSSAVSSVESSGMGNGGTVEITTRTLTVSNGAFLSSNTSGEGNAGNIVISAEDSVLLDGESGNGQSTSAAASNVQPSGMGNGGTVEITTRTLTVSNGAFLSSNTSGEGNAGNIVISAEDSVLLDGESPIGKFVSTVGSNVEPGGLGNAGSVEITTSKLDILNGAILLSNTSGEGNAGNITISAENDVLFDGESSNSQIRSSAVSSVESSGMGNGGTIEITAGTLTVSNGAFLSSNTSGEGNAGNIVISAKDTVLLNGESSNGQSSSGVGSSVEQGGVGNGGTIRITTENLEVLNSAQLVSNTLGEGNSGNIVITAEGSVLFDGRSSNGQFRSAAASSVESGGVGEGGDIEIKADNLEVTNGAFLSSNTSGEGDAGRIVISLQENLLINNGTIATSAESRSGGAVIINTASAILEGNSDIVTLVANGNGQGGDITIAGNFIIALDDSDIVASADLASDGSRGGDIKFNVRGFFGENFTTDSLTADPDTLDGNDRADVNATGTTNGVVTLPDVSFIENSLSDLSDAIVTPDQILIASCISRTTEEQGTFNITGSGGLSTSPNSDVISAYPTSDIQSPVEATTQTQWQLGDPIDEATGIYELADGRLTLSQDCS